MMRWVLPLVLLAFAGGAGAAAPMPTVQPLSGERIPHLLEPPAHGERIVMFWALSCVYCEPNMKALAQLQRAHPKDIELLMVATDDIHGNRRAIAARLREAGVATYPAWAYDEAVPQRLDFLVDPNWGGELPRTLVILGDGTRAAVSGRLTPAALGQLWPLPHGAANSGATTAAGIDGGS